MKITIANRYRPFSLIPGTSVPLPGTPFAFSIFPTEITILNLITNDSLTKKLPINGPVNNFAIFLDLEKCKITVQGNSPTGFFRYSILQQPDHISLKWKNGSSESILPYTSTYIFQNPERLHLGSDKKQDWDLIRRRQDMSEIFPIWFALGQTYKNFPCPAPKNGAADLLSTDSLPMLFKAGFHGILTPQLSDPLHQGIITSSGSGSPIGLLPLGADLIRSLFITQDSNTINILPNTPPEFHCGRFTGLLLDGIGSLDMEWTKKLIRRIVVRITTGGTIVFNFRHAIRMRIRRGENDHGTIISTEQPIETVTGERILFDRFEK